MSGPRGSFLAALLVLSVQAAYATTLTVNTTSDDNAANSLCSLREAVEYFNRDTPAAGFQGCVTTVTGGIGAIVLPASTTPYEISGPAIAVRRSLQINGEGASGSAVTKVQVIGPHRAFFVSDNPTYLPPGCAATSSCEQTPAPGQSAAPALDPLSDTSGGDYLTTTTNPKFSGSYTHPGAPHVVMVRLWDTPVGGERTLVGIGYVTTTNTWSITPVITLEYAEHQLTTTFQVDTDPESADSAATTLRVYEGAYNNSVTFSALEIIGCGVATNCANNVDALYSSTGNVSSSGLVYDYTVTGTSGNGGVIFSTEKVILSGAIVRDGNASALGGAVYGSSVSAMEVVESELSGSSAGDGAAIYLNANSLLMSKSLVTGNTTTAAGGAAISIASVTVPSGGNSTNISNSTIGKNSAAGLSLLAGMIVKSATVVENTGGGIDFNGEAVKVYNTILAGNQSAAQDCVDAAAAVVQFSLLQTGTACPTAGNQLIDGVAGGVGQLLANSSCDSPFGLLCPLADNGGSTRSYLPRVLAAYNTFDVSAGSAVGPVIIGRASSTSSLESSCLSNDQRGLSRTTDPCDIGAVEFKGGDISVSSGGFISYGQTLTMSMREGLGDEELLATGCPATAPTAPATGYRNNVPGCPWLEVPPGRGVVVFNADGTYSYTPSSNFHGTDKFTIRVMTTLTKLYGPADMKSHAIPVQVVVDPPSGISSDSVGLIDWAALSVLLLGFVRLRAGRERV
ncbi:MAG TPA: Ig-like domain-containing protein [Moraxellaceae bacterium]